MRRWPFLSFVTLLGCAPIAASVRVEPSEHARVEAPPANGIEGGSDGSSHTVHPILGGRFEFALPTAIALRASSVWAAPDELRAYYDAYEFDIDECSMTLAVRSHGLMRPSEVPLRDGETRLFVPSEDASPHLEIVRTQARTFEFLDVMQAAVGAVAFEPDGSATDFFLWPQLAGAAPEGDEGNPEDWFAAQRSDPRLARCYGLAETLLRDALPTLAVRRPFSLAQTQLHFGYDEERDASFVFEGAIPSGWIITLQPAYDASFEDLHRRQPWTWVDVEPTQRARIWSFDGLASDDEPPPRGPRRARLFGLDLRFDRGEGDDGQCARFEQREAGLTHTVCLRGTPAEQDELVAILRSFAPVQSSRAEATPASQTCVTRIQDADGQTNVRASASSRSDVVGTISNGTVIVPVGQQGRWLRIATPHLGWVYANHVARQCE